jgi:hypothetical protein
VWKGCVKEIGAILALGLSGSLLQSCVDLIRDDCSRFYGGFMPKRDARTFLGGTDAAVLRTQLDIAVERGYLLPDVRRLRVRAKLTTHTQGWSVQ